VRDATGGFFGVFVGEGIYSNPGAYHGGGESFVFSSLSSRILLNRHVQFSLASGGKHRARLPMGRPERLCRAL
jgi:hypothetical protein